MSLTPDKTHLTALDIILELRCWLVHIPTHGDRSITFMPITQ